MSLSGEALDREIFSLLSNKSLCEPDDLDHITVLSTYRTDNGAPSSTIAYPQTAEELDQHLRAPSANSTSARLYNSAAHQQNSWSHLKLSASMLKRVYQEHPFMARFFTMLRGFCEKDYETGASYAPPFESNRTDRYVESAYVLRYAERRSVTKYEPWAVRQCALYHAFDIDDRKSVYILITPNLESRVETDIKEWLETAQHSDNTFEAHFGIHQVLMGYLDNWKAYLDVYEEQLLRLEAELSYIKADDYLTTRPTALHSLHARLLPIKPALEIAIQTMEEVQHLYDSNTKDPITDDSGLQYSKQLRKCFASHRKRVVAITRHLDVLVSKCAAMTGLLDRLESSKNRKIARQQNLQLTELTKATLHDSTAIRVITVITLLYLSLTAVATVMDTPFFQVDTVGHLHMSSQFWIYAVISIMLTTATMIYWRWQLQRRMRERSTTGSDQGDFHV